MIERKKQRKLTFLANDAGRIVEAHIVRTIFKPYIRDLNKKWSKMTALKKLKTVPPLRLQSLIYKQLIHSYLAKYFTVTLQSLHSCLAKSF